MTSLKRATTLLTKYRKFFFGAVVLAIALFFYQTHLAKEEARAFIWLGVTGQELLDRARLIQGESASACFLYAGDEFESKWLRHFGKNRGWPHLRDCDTGLYSHLVFWGDFAKTDYLRTHVIVFQKPPGYLLSPARR